MPELSNSPNYKVVVKARSAVDMSPTTTVAVVNNAKNIGWSNYLNDVPEAFFTLLQHDPMVDILQPYLGKAHVLIYRQDHASGLEWLVWAGTLGTEIDSRSRDVVFYAHGYLHHLFYQHSAWGTVWTDQHIGTIVTSMWLRSKTVIPNSENAWVSTGTIHAPATTSGGATPIILPTYQVFYKRILFIMRDLADIGRSDTTNNVVFEITPAGVFNFWGDRGTDRDVLLDYDSRAISDFQVVQQPVERRTTIFAVGSSPRDILMRKELYGVTNTGWGRREEAIMLTWVRDQTELDRIARLRQAKANRDFLNLNLTLRPGLVIPPMDTAGTNASFGLSDRIRIRINKGTVNINKYMLVSGVQVLYMNGLENTRLILEDTFG